MKATMKATIGELATFLTSGSRGWAKYYSEEGRLFLRIQNVKDGNLLLDDVIRVAPPESAESRRTAVQSGDLLISITADLGRTAVVPEGLGPAHINQHLALVRLSGVDPHYVAKYLASPEGQRQFTRLNREAVKAGLNFDDIRSLEIPLPPLAEQKRIAAILDKADAIRRKLQQFLRLSDDFLRSVFLDMFGDPKTNSKGWPEEPMSELMSDTKIGLVRASDQFGWNMPVPYVRMDALTNDGAFLPEKVQGTNATPAEIASYSLKPGDLLFNTRNSKELVGKVAVYPGPEGATFNNNLMRIRFREGIDPHVICAQFQFPRVQRELEARKQGTTSVFAVYGKNLATLQFLVPPSDLQRDYRKVVDKVSAARQKMKSLLAESESTFSSLQQRAFRGEL